MRQELTDLQLRQLMATCDRAAANRAMFTNVEAGQIRRLVGELQELRSRESVTRYLHEIEAI